MDKNNENISLIRILVRESLIQELSNVEQIKAAFGAGVDASLKKGAESGKSNFSSDSSGLDFSKIEDEAKSKGDVAMEIISKASLHIIDINNLLDILGRVLSSFKTKLNTFSDKIIDVSSASQQDLVDFIKEIQKVNQAAGETAGAALEAIEKSASGKSMNRLSQIKKNTEEGLNESEMWMYWSGLKTTFEIYISKELKDILSQSKKLFSDNKVKDYLKSQRKENPKLIELANKAAKVSPELVKKSETVLKAIEEYKVAGEKIKKIQDEMELSAYKADLNNQYSATDK